MLRNVIADLSDDDTLRVYFSGNLETRLIWAIGHLMRQGDSEGSFLIGSGIS